MGDHYFTSEPSSQKRINEISVELAGKSLKVNTSPGIFSPGGVDKGTAVLLSHAPFTPLAREQENVLDVGCGWGAIALTAGLLDPSAHVYGVDVNERSLELARMNAEKFGLNFMSAQPEDLDPELRFDRIYSNPPIRVGKESLHEILLTWLPRLSPGGMAWLVVQKNLGADSLQRWLAENLDERMRVARAYSSKGFRILTVTRTP